MAGLNDEFLLDYSTERDTKLPVKAFTETVPGQVPKLSDNVTLIAAPLEDDSEDDTAVQKTGEIASVAIEELEITCRDMELFSTRIQQEGGMSLAIAKESLTVLPGFVNDDVRPMGFFTKHPSKTQLNEALEAIDDTVKNAAKVVVEKITALIEAVKKQVAKIIERIKNAFSDHSPAKYRTMREDLSKIKWSDIPQNTKEYLAKNTLKRVVMCFTEGNAVRDIDEAGDVWKKLLEYFLNGGEFPEKEFNHRVSYDDFEGEVGRADDVALLEKAYPEIIKGAAAYERNFREMMEVSEKTQKAFDYLPKLQIELGKISHLEDKRGEFNEISRRIHALSHSMMMFNKLFQYNVLIVHTHDIVTKKIGS